MSVETEEPKYRRAVASGSSFARDEREKFSVLITPVTTCRWVVLHESQILKTTVMLLTNSGGRF